MKIKWDKQYLKYSLYATLTVVLSIMFYQILENVGVLINLISDHFRLLRIILSPFIIGAFIAYLLNPGVRWLEKNVFLKINAIKSRRRLIRTLSILTIFVLAISMVVTLSFFVAPEISQNVGDLLRRVPEYFDLTSEFVSEKVQELEVENIKIIEQHIEQHIEGIFNTASGALEYVSRNLVGSLLTITTGIFNFVLALIISFYILSEKESFKIGAEKILFLFLKKEHLEKVKSFGREADELFAKFIVGKSLDSLIIGILCIVGLSLMNIRYALLLGVIVTITNMIPYFGPFIGGAPAVAITFFDSPMKALWVAIFILALQQFDGLYLGPKILGDSVGLSPLWVIFAIIIGGKLAGVLGMFLGVPVFAIIRLLIVRLIDRLIEIKVLKEVNTKESPIDNEDCTQK
ncbi:AI-2E family transporter [Serpentinicella sp. ANB-PHB4]|uniref:AI-2E family transporter n=1 Tax=Serpentinicella sp. ANB-PHB4 TaxID=3074076 RepID=UPI0028566ED3|nr:AI-2E family transporter [Serpentinicella sp. ANB-PHB4]MDR5659146.1 AI-2E family transporter [Serpentinicella sp. ANB-PHB4]